MATNLKELKAELEVARDAVQAESDPLHAKAEALRAQIAPLEAQLREVTQQIKVLEQPKLRDILMDLSKIRQATTTPTHRLTNEGQAVPSAEPPSAPPA